MTWRHLSLGAALMMALTTPVLTQNLGADLQRAKQREAETGDCKALLPEYARIAEQGAKADRVAAAEALLRVGICQERTDNRMARVTYARVVSDFRDQRNSADDAGRRLASLQTSDGGAVRAGGRQDDASPFERRPTVTDNVPGELSFDRTRVLEFAEGIVERRLSDRSRRILVAAEEFDGDRVASRTGRGIWSLDDRRVAYTSTVFLEDSAPGSPALKVELRIVETDSLKVHTVLELPAPGGQLRYALRGWTADNEVLYSENRRSTGGSDVAEFWAVPSAGGGRRKVFAIDRGTGTARVSNVTSDGRQIVIVRDEHLAIVDLRSGVERAISLGIDPAYPQISRDGKALAYLSRVDGAWGLYVAPLAEQIRTWVRVSSLSARGTMPPNAQVRWLADGTSLALTYENRGEHLYRLDVDATNLAPVGTPHRLTRDTEATSPRISPDGVHVAFVRPAAARDGSLFVVRSDGSGERRIAEIPVPTRGMFRTFDWWSAGELAFVGPGSSELQRIPLTGTAAIGRVPVGGPVERISIDSEAGVAVLSRPLLTPDARPSLVIRHLVDGRETPISELYGSNWRVSPDRTRVAMFAIPWDDFLAVSVADNQNLWALWLLSVDGSQPKKLVPGQGSTLVWGPGGAHLLLGNQSNGLKIFNVKTGDVRPFFTLDPVQMFGHGASAALGPADWAPDGSFVVFSIAVTGTTNVAWQGVTYDAVTRLMKGSRQ